MQYKVLQGYMALCRFYGWKPTWAGLKAFNRGDRARSLKRGEPKK
ncbi:hypothetical protein [Caproiciproducens faecalis]|nr:hypothetical protein [Caproiciproducens faecalis]